MRPLPDIADVLYHVHRCAHGHGDEVVDGFELKLLISNESELLLQYRMMSGFVHGLVWSTYSGAKVRNFQGDKSAMVELKGNSSNIYNGATTALIVVRAAKARLVELGDHRDDE